MALKGLKCNRLVSHYILQSSQSDELSITEGEELQVIEDGDVEDWLKVRGKGAGGDLKIENDKGWWKELPLMFM